MEKMNDVTDVAIGRCRSAYEECKKHFARIAVCMKALENKFPLKNETFNALDDIEMALFDQFLYRFSKLQDAMGSRLIPSIYKILEADEKPKPFIDILNRLEKLGVITSVWDWQYFRNIRNSFAHEYPERENEIVAAINQLHTDWARFEALYIRVQNEAEKLFR